ncbi:hypothetical protein MOSE0_L01970 [Monosporozyma servazzii]
MSDIGDHTMNPSPFDKHPPDYFSSHSSEGSSEGANDNTVYSQKENDDTIMNQPPPASSLEEKQIKQKNLIKRIDSMGKVRDGLTTSQLLLGLISMFSFFLPVNILGMTFYSIELVCHSLSFSCLFILHYHVIPSLTAECNIISNQIEEETNYPPTSYPTKNELFWCYLKVLLSILFNTGLWIYLLSIDLPDNREYSKEETMQVIFCFLCGMVLLIVSFYALFQIDILDHEAKLKKRKTEQTKKDTRNGVNIQMHDLSLTEDEIMAAKMEEIVKARKEVLEIDSSYSKLLQEKDKIIMELLQEKDNEIKRLKQENIEGSSES